MRARWLVLAVLILLVGWVAVALYGRQTVSFLTHRTGAPEVTWPIEPFLEPPLLRVAVTGDIGEGEVEEWDTAAAMFRAGQSDPYDVLLLLGDNVYPDGDPERLDDTVFRPFDDVMDAGAELLAIVGNHDAAGGQGLQQIRALGMPGLWWSRSIDDVLFVGLDSNRVGDPAQAAWLEDTLRNATEPWKIVAIHESPYSAGYQGSNLEVRERFAPLFERYGVQLVLSGHDHDFQRSRTIDGVTYVVSGAGGRTRGTGEEDFTAASWSVLHFVDLAVFEDHLLVRAITQDGRVFDEVTIPIDAVHATPPTEA
jgi:predicted phosphodiesterase